MFCRLQKRKAMEWGYVGFEDEEVERPEFKGIIHYHHHHFHCSYDSSSYYVSYISNNHIYLNHFNVNCII